MFDILYEFRNRREGPGGWMS